MRAALGTAALAAVLGCSGPDVTMVYVNIDAPPAVHGVDYLYITLANAAETVTEGYELNGATLPLDFSFTAEGREGEVEVIVEGYEDYNGQELLRGYAFDTVTLVQDQRVDAEIMLETADFVVNSGVAGAQALTSSNAAGRGQIAVAGDGSFVMVYESGCTGTRTCQIMARRFGNDTKPLVNQVNSTDSEFPVALSTEYGYGHSPSVAVNNGQYLLTWVVRSESLGDDAILGVRLDLETRRISTIEHILGASNSSGAIFDQQVVALSNGEFLVLWRSTEGPAPTLYGQYVGTDGESIGLPIPLYSGARLFGPTAVATGPGRAFVALWNDMHNVWYVPVDGMTPPLPAHVKQLTRYGACDECDVYGPSAVVRDGVMTVAWSWENVGVTPEVNAVYVQQVPLQDGASAAMPIEVARNTNTARDFFYKPALAMAADGSSMVTWADCGATGDDSSSCGIFAQQLAPDGALAGEPMLINTTIAGNQQHPAIAAMGAAIGGRFGKAWLVAWTDDSASPPDISPSAVRARMVYTP